MRGREGFLYTLCHVKIVLSVVKISLRVCSGPQQPEPHANDFSAAGQEEHRYTSSPDPPRGASEQRSRRGRGARARVSEQ